VCVGGGRERDGFGGNFPTTRVVIYIILLVKAIKALEIEPKQIMQGFSNSEYPGEIKDGGGEGVGYSTHFFFLHPEVQPFTLLYTIFTKKVPFNCCKCHFK